MEKRFRRRLQRHAIELEWKTNWRDRCDGKRLIDDLYVRYEIAMRKIEFKRQIMVAMKKNKTDNWRTIKELLSEALS